MFGTGKEQISQIRMSHLEAIIKDLKTRKKPGYQPTLTIERHSTDYYTVGWQVTDHFGRGYEYIFEEDKIKEVKIHTKWRS